MPQRKLPSSLQDMCRATVRDCWVLNPTKDFSGAKLPSVVHRLGIDLAYLLAPIGSKKKNLSLTDFVRIVNLLNPDDIEQLNLAHFCSVRIAPQLLAPYKNLKELHCDDVTIFTDDIPTLLSQHPNLETFSYEVTQGYEQPITNEHLIAIAKFGKNLRALRISTRVKAMEDSDLNMYLLRNTVTVDGFVGFAEEIAAGNKLEIITVDLVVDLYFANGMREAALSTFELCPSIKDLRICGHAHWSLLPSLAQPKTVYGKLTEICNGSRILHNAGILGCLPNLESLRLCPGQISDEEVLALGSCQKLTKLDLNGYNTIAIEKILRAVGYKLTHLTMFYWGPDVLSLATLCPRLVSLNVDYKYFPFSDPNFNFKVVPVPVFNYLRKLHLSYIVIANWENFPVGLQHILSMVDVNELSIEVYGRADLGFLIRFRDFGKNLTEFELQTQRCTMTQSDILAFISDRTLLKKFTILVGQGGSSLTNHDVEALKSYIQANNLDLELNIQVDQPLISRRDRQRRLMSPEYEIID